MVQQSFKENESKNIGMFSLYFQSDFQISYFKKNDYHLIQLEKEKNIQEIKSNIGTFKKRILKTFMIQG